MSHLSLTDENNSERLIKAPANEEKMAKRRNEKASLSWNEKFIKTEGKKLLAFNEMWYEI